MNRVKVSPLKSDSPILIAADDESHALQVAHALVREFDDLRTSSTQVHRLAAEFDAHPPAAFVVWCNTLDAARRACERLCWSSHKVHCTRHRTIVLCEIGEAALAYEACRSGHFDDYVPFRPAWDVPRLALAIHHALHLYAEASCDAPGTSGLAFYARRMTDSETALEELARRFAYEVEKTNRMAAAGECASHSVDPRFPQIAQSVDALCRAAHALAGALGPHLKAAHALCEMVERGRPNVLAIGDDFHERHRLELLLGGTQIELACAASGAQAFSTICRRHPDLVLVDIDLPDVNGIELTRRLKAEPTLADIPVIIVSAHSHRANVIESVRAGAADFMVKPFCRATLLEKLAAFLPSAVA